MALEYSNVEVELKEISLKKKPQSFMDLSSKATVPVLVLSEQEIIDESRDIMMWSLTQNDPDQWYFNLSSADQFKSNELIDYNDDQFKPLLDNYKYSTRFPEFSETQHRERAESFLRQLNQNLERSMYLISDKISLTDIAIFPFIRQFAFVDKQWFDQSSYIHLQRWLQSCIELPLFKKIMIKVPSVEKA